MSKLKTIDDSFVDEYISNHRKRLNKPTMGGTDWRFADIVAPAFKEILEIANPECVLEIGFNIGGSALMFLSINPKLVYHSIDIVRNNKSIGFLEKKFSHFEFQQINSKNILPGCDWLNDKYDLVSIDGDHTKEGVADDIEKSLLFSPKFILFDDVRHPSHKYIEEIILNHPRLEIVKLFEFNHCWQGYSFAICKVKPEA